MKYTWLSNEASAVLLPRLRISFSYLENLVFIYSDDKYIVCGDEFPFARVRVLQLICSDVKAKE